MMQSTQSVKQISEGNIFHIKKGLDFLPFYGVDGTTNFSDNFLAQVYRKIVLEESANKVFYDGSITNTTDFIKFIRDKEKEIFFVEYGGKEVGFFWLEKFRKKSSFITYCFFREFWGEQALEISRSSIKFIFERQDSYGEYLTDVLLGLTPATNKLAIKFLLKNGMTVLGKLPGILFDVKKGSRVDGVFSYKQRSKDTKISFPTFLMIH